MYFVTVKLWCSLATCHFTSSVRLSVCLSVFVCVCVLTCLLCNAAAAAAAVLLCSPALKYIYLRLMYRSFYLSSSSKLFLVLFPIQWYRVYLIHATYWFRSCCRVIRSNSSSSSTYHLLNNRNNTRSYVDYMPTAGYFKVNTTSYLLWYTQFSILVYTATSAEYVSHLRAVF